MPTELTRRPAPRPCDSCPYRRDVPSGVWVADEYRKLLAYDRETPYQPTGVFLCHLQNGHVCAGWAGCHRGDDLLALRLAVASGGMTVEDAVATIDYRSPVPLFSSGAEACAHGLADVDAPGADAHRAMAKVRRGREASRA